MSNLNLTIQNRQTKRLFFILTITFFMALLYLAISAPPGKSGLEKTFIVKNNNIKQLKAQVKSVGGKINRQYSVIKGLSVTLTNEQYQELSKINENLTFFIEQPVNFSQPKEHKKTPNKAQFNIASSRSSSPIRYAINNNQLVWQQYNKNDITRSLVKLHFQWPTSNGDITQTIINGQQVVQGVSGGDTLVQLDTPFTIAANSEINITTDFTNTAANALSYSLVFEFDDGSKHRFGTDIATPLQSTNRDTYVSTQVNAHIPHTNGYTGAGVGVAVIDSGLGQFNQIDYDTFGQPRNIYRHSVIDSSNASDENGHGSHIALSLIHI